MGILHDLVDSLHSANLTTRRYTLMWRNDKNYYTICAHDTRPAIRACKAILQSTIDINHRLAAVVVSDMCRLVMFGVRDKTWAYAWRDDLGCDEWLVQSADADGLKKLRNLQLATLIVNDLSSGKTQMRDVVEHLGCK